MNSLRSNFCRPCYCGPALQYSYVQGKKKLIESKNGIKVWQTTNSHRLYSAPGVDIPIKKNTVRTSSLSIVQQLSLITPFSLVVLFFTVLFVSVCFSLPISLFLNWIVFTQTLTISIRSHHFAFVFNFRNVLPVGQPSGWRLSDWRTDAILKDSQQERAGWLGASMTAFCEMQKSSESRLFWLWVVISSFFFFRSRWQVVCRFVKMTNWWSSRTIFTYRIHEKKKTKAEECFRTKTRNLPVFSSRSRFTLKLS